MQQQARIFAKTGRAIGSFSTALAVLFFTLHAAAGEIFESEAQVATPVDVPTPIAESFERNLSHAEKECLTDSKTTAKGALEAARLDLGGSVPALLLKPRGPTEPQAAWGCFCGAHACPMWIYASETAAPHRILSTAGDSLEIIDRQDNGMKRLLVSGGSAGQQAVELYAWGGQEYKVLRKKAIRLGRGDDADERAKQDLVKFRADAIR
ncbi:MAG: hypothetical protein ACM31D_05670 [Bacteroidota bacterium]